MYGSVTQAIVHPQLVIGTDVYRFVAGAYNFWAMERAGSSAGLEIWPQGTGRSRG
jgi:hypothetical protein